MCVYKRLLLSSLVCRFSGVSDVRHLCRRRYCIINLHCVFLKDLTIFIEAQLRAARLIDTQKRPGGSKEGLPPHKWWQRWDPELIVWISATNPSIESDNLPTGFYTDFIVFSGSHYTIYNRHPLRLQTPSARPNFSSSSLRRRQ